jgi:hypothetical protein
MMKNCRLLILLVFVALSLFSVLTFNTATLFAPPPPFDTQGNTTIIAPQNNSHALGTITIEVEVVACNCTATTALYVDRVFVSNGTRESMVQHGEIWYERFTHRWNSRSVSNGLHQLKVLGKHPQYSDMISVEVNNGEGEADGIPGLHFSLMVAAFAIMALLYGKIKEGN